MGCIQSTKPRDDDSDTDSSTIPTPLAQKKTEVALQSKSPTQITTESPPHLHNMHMTSLSYRTKKVIVYKPQIQKLKTQPHRSKRRSTTTKHVHYPQKSKDDLNLYFDTKRYGITQIDYDTECVTDIDEIEVDNNNTIYNDIYNDDVDNQTVIHHTDNSLLNYDSDTLTYHAYGGGGHANYNNSDNNDSSNQSNKHTNTNTMIQHDLYDNDIDTGIDNSNDTQRNSRNSSNDTQIDHDETSVEDEHNDDYNMNMNMNVNESNQINKSMILKKILMNSKNIQIKENKIDKSEQKSTSEVANVQKQNVKVLISEDMNVISDVLNDITKDNCLNKLETLGIVTYVFVEINQFDRWNNRNIINNIINLGDDNYETYKQNPNQYIKMAYFRLNNSKLLIKLGEKEKELFKILILYGIERCKNIYKINFNSANITNSFLGRILQIFENRNKNNEYYGPELLFIENNPISDRGVEMICKYIKQNGKELKHIAVGHCFANISINNCLLFCQSLKHNQSILKITFDLKNMKHRQSVDKSLKNNYSKYIIKQKQIDEIVE